MKMTYCYCRHRQSMAVMLLHLVFAISFISAQAKAFTAHADIRHPLSLTKTQSWGGAILQRSTSPSSSSSSSKLEAMPTAAVTTSIGMSIIRSLRGGAVGEVSDIIMGAYDWNMNMGGPSALVAGAVVATLYENMSSGDLEINKTDARWVKITKRTTRFLLLSAFALEVLCLFVTTVTGSMLLSRPLPVLAALSRITDHTTPLSFLQDNFEFEYLSARVTFLQGILNWITAIGLSHLIPSSGSKWPKKMNKFIASLLLSTTFLMLSFYNTHMTFYKSYWQMLIRWIHVLGIRFVTQFPTRPLMIMFVMCLVPIAYFGYDAFSDDDDI
jgi:hypothetical protein